MVEMDVEEPGGGTVGCSSELEELTNWQENQELHLSVLLGHQYLEVQKSQIHQ